MRKRTKILSVLLVLSLLAGSWGCGNAQKGAGNNESSAKAPEAASETAAEEGTAQELNLTVWGGLPYEDGVGEILEGFMEKYPNVKVEYTRFTNDEAGNTKLDTALLTGEQINVYFTYSTDNVANRVAGGMAADLADFGGDKYIEENIGTDGVFKVDDKYYSLPTAKEPTCMMLNKDLLDKAGIPIPQEWTIEEFREIARKLHDPENGVYGVYPGFYDSVFPIATMVLGSNAWYNADGTGANFSAPEFKLDKLSYDLIFTDKTAYPYEEAVSKQALGFWDRLFVSENIAMAMFQPWMCGTLRDQEEFPHEFVTAFAPIPVPEEGREYYNPGEMNNFMMINSKSEHKQEAWELLKYWVEDGVEALLPYGKIPVNKNYNDPGMAAKILQDEEGKFFDASSFAVAALDPEMKYICNTNITAAVEIKQIRKEESQKLLLGEQSFEEYLENLQSRCDAAIKEANK